MENTLETIKSDEYIFPKDLSRYFLQLETTNVCNHRCSFCVNSAPGRKKGFMDAEFAKRMIREACEMGIRKGAFFIFGEPLADRNILEYYRFARDIGYRFLAMVTNGALADEAVIRDIFDSGIRVLKFSVNGGTRENYHKIHGADDYERVMRNIEYAYAYRNEHHIPCSIDSSYVLTKESAPYLEEHMQRIGKITDHFIIHKLSDMANSIEDRYRDLLPEDRRNILNQSGIRENTEVLDFAPGLPCRFLGMQVCVSVDGYLKLCCSDPTDKTAVADLHQMSLKEAFFSENMRRIRENHLKKEIGKTPCGHCVGVRH